MAAPPPSGSRAPRHLDVVHGRPSTFAERGVCVPFTTPSLAQARVRSDHAERLECLLPGFSGGKGTFIFSWRAVTEIVRMTLHDRALHREILERRANSPDAIRRATLVVASRGLAGLAAQERAMDALEEERQAVVTTNFLFMVELLRTADMDVRSLLGTDQDTARKAAQAALSRVAARFGVAPDTMFARVEQVSTDLAPVGFPQAPKAGRLRDLLHRLQWLRDDMGRWAGDEPSELSQTARFLGECAAQTLTLATQRVAGIDPQLGRLQDLVVSDLKTEELRQSISRLSWLLDGWDYLCRLWEDSREEPDDLQRLAIFEMARIAPAVPMEELVVNDNDDEELFESVQRRWVRANQDWRTGGLDYDMVRRIETVKAAMA